MESPRRGDRIRGRATILRSPGEVDDRAGNLHAGVVVWLAEPALTPRERARFVDKPKHGPAVGVAGDGAAS